jgi:hypothetical protein
MNNLSLPIPGQWAERANCTTNPDLMFPGHDETGIRDAKNVCRRCPVQMACLMGALRLKDYEYGIRGALRPNERKAVAKLVGDRHSDMQAVAAAVDQVKHPSSVGRTLQDAFDERVKPRADGHWEWTGQRTLPWRSGTYAPKRTSFILHRGRQPKGLVRRTPDCRFQDCVNPLHLEDEAERLLRVGAAREARELEQLARQARKASAA